MANDPGKPIRKDVMLPWPSVAKVKDMDRVFLYVSRSLFCLTSLGAQVSSSVRRPCDTTMTEVTDAIEEQLKEDLK